MKKVIDFISKSSSGMALGLFSTLIVGTILKQLFSIGNGFQIGLDIASTLTNLMGVGIALGIGLSINKDLSPLEVIALSVIGGIASSINLVSPSTPIPTFTINGGSKNPLHIYLVVILTLLIIKKLITKKTPLDILLIPLLYVTIGSILGFILIYPSYYLIYGIQLIIENSMPLIPIIMSIIISAIMGMILTMPISSVAVCVSLSIGNIPLAAGAALIGCTTQMIGFATQSFRSNNPIGKTISVGIGTSMLYWPNIIKKPLIWLPTILSSMILGPIGVCLLQTTSTSAGAGMGSCGIVGQLSCIETMGISNPLTWISIVIVQLLGSIILTSIFDFILKDKLHLYTDEDLLLK
jgi:uncharacterized membrane protein